MRSGDAFMPRYTVSEMIELVAGCLSGTMPLDNQCFIAFFFTLG